MRTILNKKITRLVSSIIFCLSIASLHGQTRVTGPITGTSAAGEYYSYTGITLSPNFTFTATTGQSFHAFILGNGCLPLQATPNQNQNYISTITPRVDNIRSQSDLLNPTTCEVSQSIQYLDGLGRPLQTIDVKSSPSNQDIVQPLAYDEIGRERKKYLNYASSSGNAGSYRPTAVADQLAFYHPAGTDYLTAQLPGNIAHIPSPYAETGFEPSPLNRLREQGAPGDPWQLTGTVNPSTVTSGHTIRKEYVTNNSIVPTDQVNGYSAVIYRISGINTTTQQRTLSSGATALVNYDEGLLSVTISKNENWISGKAGTMEEYRDKEGHIVLMRTFNMAAGASVLEVLSTYYVYDDLNNLAYVLPPKSNADNILPIQTLLDDICYQYRYDERGRLIQKKMPGKGWEFLVYNRKDQVVATQNAVQRNKAPQEWAVKRYDAMARVIMTGLYNFGEAADIDNRALVQSQADGFSPLWETPTGTLANYGYTSATFPASINIFLTINFYDDYGFAGVNPYPFSGGTVRTRGLATGSLTNVLGTADMLWTITYYDDQGRNIKKFSQHYLGGSVSNSNYDLVTNTYDFVDLIASERKHFTVNSSNPTLPVVTVNNRYEYDDAGRKTNVFEKINSGDEVQLIKNEYNEIGQLKTKHLHKTQSSTSFLQDIDYKYNERGWLNRINDPIASTSPTRLFSETIAYNLTQFGASPQFNGNIAEQSYKVDGSETPGVQSVTYTYDPLNRLTDGINSSGFSETGITYDAMGNILSLNRATAPNNVNLNFVYNGNQLQTVKNGLAPFRDYLYDLNGNVKSDGTGNAIYYNMLDLPQSVPGKNLSYVYDALGNKLRRISNGTITEYISGIQYNGNVIDFILTEEGRAINSTGNYTYEYTLSDHLGNNRVTFDNSTGKKGEDDYYPFGLHVSRLYNAGSKYLYNKKELQDELNQYDFGARFYDPIIGRWTSVDPLGEKMTRFSPYVYGDDNSIRNIDPDGMESQDCCGFMGPMAGVSAYLAYLEIKQSVQSVFGLKTYAEGAVDKVNNQIHKQDPGYVDNVPEKVRAIHDKLMDDRADVKAYTGALQWGAFNMGLVTTAMGALEGPLGNTLGTVRGPIDGYAGNIFQSIETKSPFELTPTHSLTLSKRQFNLLKDDIKTNGISTPIRYVEHNGTNFVVNGHHRLRIAKQLDINQVPVKKVQLPYRGYKTIGDLNYTNY